MLEMYMYCAPAYPNNVTFLSPHEVTAVAPSDNEGDEPLCYVSYWSGNSNGEPTLATTRMHGSARVIAAAVAQSKLVPYIVQCPKPLSATKGEG